MLLSWNFKNIVNGKLFAMSPNIAKLVFLKDWTKAIKSIIDTGFNGVVSERYWWLIEVSWSSLST